VIGILNRNTGGAMNRAGITLPDGFEPKQYMASQRQFAEAALSGSINGFAR